MTRQLKIDFVSDVVCPWCAIGLLSLNAALKRLEGEVTAEIRFRPFELNPNMAPAGENIAEHIGRKYGSTPAQLAANHQAIAGRAAALGFTMKLGGEQRIWNTFDAHRLLAFAYETGGAAAQMRLKVALLTAHFTENRNISDAGVLADVAASAGLDGADAAALLASDRYAADVRADQADWRAKGINSVPAVVIEDKWLVSGGQPVEVFEEALRGIASEVGAGT